MQAGRYTEKTWSTGTSQRMFLAAFVMWSHLIISYPALAHFPSLEAPVHSSLRHCRGPAQNLSHPGHMTLSSGISYAMAHHPIPYGKEVDDFPSHNILSFSSMARLTNILRIQRGEARSTLSSSREHTNTRMCHIHQPSTDKLSLYARYTPKRIASVPKPTPRPHTPPSFDVALQTAQRVYLHH